MKRFNAMAASVLLMGLVGCDSAGEGVPPDPGRTGGPEQTPAETVASVTVEPGHTIEFLRFKDGTIVLNERGAGGTPRLSQSLIESHDVVEIFKQLAPGSEVPEQLFGEPQADLTTAGAGKPHKQVNETILSSDMEVRASLPPVKAGGTETVQRAFSTGMANCPFSWVIGNTNFPGCTYGQKWPVQVTSGDAWWCLANASWAYVHDPSAKYGDSQICVDHGTADYYVSYDGQSKQQYVGAGQWSQWYVAKKYKCGWGLFWYSCDVTVDGRAIQFGISPTDATSHFAGHIVR
jgi:hypothetical protein